MVIVIRSERAKSPEDAATLCTLFAHAFMLKITPGFIRGECAIKVDDPCAVIGIEYWATKAALVAFSACEDTRRAFADVADYEVRP